VLGSSDATEGTFIGVDMKDGVAMVNSTNQGVYNLRNETGLAAPLIRHAAAENIYSGSDVLIHAYVDGSLLEVIFNNSTAFSVRVAPSSPRSTYIRVHSADSVESHVESWELRPTDGVKPAPPPPAPPTKPPVLHPCPLVNGVIPGPPAPSPGPDALWRPRFHYVGYNQTQRGHIQDPSGVICESRCLA
jgi:hypothetical protein